MSDFESPWTRKLRGNVVRAGIAHLVVAWLFLQVADVVLPYVGVVDQPVRWALVVSVATFPATVFIAWLVDAGWRVGEFLVILIAAVAAGWWVTANLPEMARERTSLVILPFEYGEDAAGEGISRALAREVGSLLMKSRSIDVISDESARSPLLQGLGTVAVAERLSVGAILSGSVAASEDDMRIELRLLDAAGEALWESVIEESVANLFAVQERVATEIERRLGAGQDKVPIAQLAAERCWMPNDADALRRYFTARHYIQARTGTDESRRHGRTSISIPTIPTTQSIVFAKWHPRLRQKRLKTARPWARPCTSFPTDTTTTIGGSASGNSSTRLSRWSRTNPRTTNGSSGTIANQDCVSGL